MERKRTKRKWLRNNQVVAVVEIAMKKAFSELGMTDEIDHVTDFGQIAAMGVMSTPALVIDNKVVSMGKVLSKDDVIKALKKVRG